MKFQIHNFKTLPSTNTYALDKLADLAHGDVIVAEEQTAGRGRQGRQWQSQSGKNLAFSIVFKEELKAEDLHAYSQMTSLALFDTLNDAGMKDVWIKWPNDLYLGKAKIAGMLCETSFSGQACDGLIVGLGLNVNSTLDDFSGLGVPATSMIIESSDDEPYKLNEVLSYFLSKFNFYYQKYLNDDFFIAHHLWVVRTELIGKNVYLLDGERRIEGKVDSFKEDGTLILSREGKLEAYRCGDLSLRLS